MTTIERRVGTVAATGGFGQALRDTLVVAWRNIRGGLRVPDVGAAVEEVRAAGAEVIGIEDTGVCQMGFVKDPDGNVFVLSTP